MERWAFKHPAPDDFFRTIENVSGEDLSWFWRGWFVNNWRLDQGINSIKYVNNNPKSGVYITIENFEKMAMPVVLDVKSKSGKVTRVKLPVEIWQRNKVWTFKHNSTEEIESISIDPDHVFPDSNESNNSWTSVAGVTEKDINLDGYLGIFSNQYSPLKVIFAKKRGVVIVEMADYPDFLVEFVGDNTFKTKEVDVKFKFNESKNGFDLIMPDGQKIPFTREK